MNLHNTVKSISYVKSHASEILKKISDSHATYVITQNGEAKAVIQDIEEYDKLNESLAMLKMIAQGTKEIKTCRTKPFTEAFRSIHVEINKKKSSLK